VRVTEADDGGQQRSLRVRSGPDRDIDIQYDRFTSSDDAG